MLIEAIRALGRIGDPAAAAPLLRFIHDASADPQVRLEAVVALGGIAATRQCRRNCTTRCLIC